MTTARTPSGLTSQLTQLAWPLMLSNLAYSMLGVTDTLFMGRLGQVEVGAVGLGWMYAFTLTLLFRSYTNSVTTFVARAFGANEPREMRKWYGVYFTISVLLALIITLLGQPLLNWIVQLSNPEPELAKALLTYARIRLLETPFALLVILNVGFLLGVGNSRIPLILSWMTVILNALLAWVFIFQFHWGVAGAAWGAFISVVVQCVVSFVVLFKLHGVMRPLWPHWRDSARTLRLGIPMGLADLSEVAGFAVFMTIISRLGTLELAASQIANQMASFGFMPAFALSAATGSLVSRFIGEQSVTTAQRVGWRGTVLGGSFMTLIAVAFIAFPVPLVNLFTHDPALVALCVQIMRVMALYQVVDGIAIILGGALSGAGDTRFRMLVTVLGSWSLLVLPAYLLTENGYGVQGAWMGALIYITAIALIYLWRFWSGRWKTKTL
ncbi:MATE family efflux transporter [Deinococcus roseus]|uniref:Multidrug-efflux transporter n=1 Tax=Deinococcus roseus TaxID=392414 RepID=A0ABQ2D0M0_9DEIO|nr:MATE family efflux transporter [Deinococcus roseus]GGJ32036.1 MATE family efflux transporter [Deinococcus roseus]